MSYAQSPSLTEEERITLQQMHLYAEKPRQRVRAQMILLASRGFSRQEIASITGVC